MNADQIKEYLQGNDDPEIDKVDPMVVHSSGSNESTDVVGEDH